MRIRLAKTQIPSQKSVIFGFVFVLAILVLLCSYIQIPDLSVSTEGTKCNHSLFAANSIPTKDTRLFLSVLFFLFAVLSLLIKRSLSPCQSFDVSFHPSLLFLKLAQEIPKLYNPIITALRRGRLQGQIYNFEAAACQRHIHASNLLTYLFGKA